MPRSSSAIVMISSTIPISLSRDAWSWLEELLPLVLGHRRVPQDVGDALRNGDRGAQLVGDVRQEIGLGRCPLCDRGPQALELVADRPLARRSRSPPRRRSRSRRPATATHRAGQRRADRREQPVGPVLAQHVPRGAGAPAPRRRRSRPARSSARSPACRASRRTAAAPAPPRRAPPARGPRSPRRGASAPRTRRLGRGRRSPRRRGRAPPGAGGTAGRRPRRRRRTRARSIAISVGVSALPASG